MDNDQLKLFVRNAPVQVAMFDRDMCYVTASPDWIFEYSLPSDFEGLSHYRFFPNIPERWKLAYSRAMAGETITRQDDECVFPSGDHRWMDWAASPWRCEEGGDIGGILIFSTNILRLKQCEQRASESEAHLHELLAGVPVAYQSLDVGGCWLDANEKMAELLGFDNPKQMIGLNFTDYWSLETRAANPFEEFKRTSTLNGEQTLVRLDGRRVTVVIVGRIERDIHGGFVRTHCALFDITERKRIENEIARLVDELERKVVQRTRELEEANRALSEIAHNDPLTELPNRRAANERIRTEFALMKRTQSVYSILMIDVDLFKSVNDNYGHDVGDAVLTGIARIFSANLRASDLISRFGGEEFMALLPHTDLPAARIVAEKLRSAVENSQLLTSVTISVGVSTASTGDAEPDTAIKIADMRLYEAKAAGRNRISA
jgi:diguanylate cyclase (GGDEF)-like protein/PAS domain S-box-containing protein